MSSEKMDVPLEVLLERDLINTYGPMVSNDALRLVLGYASKEAFRQALVRKTIPVPVFTIENRRGKFALSKDVAHWLAKQRASAIDKTK
jgi:hypothetical protein